jgi:hypothetical protein
MERVREKRVEVSMWSVGRIKLAWAQQSARCTHCTALGLQHADADFSPTDHRD